MTFFQSMMLVLNLLSKPTDATINHSLIVNINHRWVKPAELDPENIRYSSQLCLIHNLGATLVKADDDGQIRSGIAEKWQVSNNGRYIQFWINPNFRWSNGRNVDGYDVELSLKRHCLLRKNAHFPLWKYIDGCEKIKSIKDSLTGIRSISDRVVEVRLSRNVHDVLMKFTMNDFTIFPKETVDMRTLSVSWGISGGPYFVKKWSPNKMILEANRFSPDFVLEMPQTVQLSARSDWQKILSDLKSAKIHIAWQRFSPTDNLEALNSPDLNYYARDFVYTGFLALNPLTFNKRFRQEIRDRILATDHAFVSPLFERSYGVFPQGFFGSNILQSRVNKQLLGSSRLHLRVLVPSMYGPEKIGTIAQIFSEAGIEPKFEYLTIDEALARLSKGKFDAVFLICGVSTRFPDTFFRLQLQSGAFQDPNGILSNLYNSLLIAENDGDKQLALVNLITSVMDQGAFVPIWFEKIPIIVNSEYFFSSLERFGQCIPFWKARRKFL